MKERYNEILRLKGMLEKAKIPFVFSKVFGGYHIEYPASTGRVCSVIEHDYSYGREKDLLEIQGLLTKKEYKETQDTVIGYLTAEDVLKMVDELIPETIDYDCEPTPAPVKMRMTQKLANDLMDSLAALAISANGRLPVTEEEFQSCERYARKTFLRLCEEWEHTIGGTWEITSDENNTYDF